MAIEVERTIHGEVMLVAVVGALDSRGAADFEAELLSSLEESVSLLLDFSKLDYVSSAGLRVLHMVSQRLAAEGEGRALALCSLNEDVRQIIDIAGMSNRIPILATRSDALRWLADRAKMARVSALADKILRKGLSTTNRPVRAGARVGDSERSSLAAEILRGSRSAGDETSG